MKTSKNAKTLSAKEDMMTLKKYSVGIISVVILLVGCSNPAGDNTGNKKVHKFTVGYMSNLVADIGDATALGIVKKTVPAGRNARAAANNRVEKNYLVKTTVDYSAGTVEWDENSLTSVTFKKKTTAAETVTIPVLDGQGSPVFDEDGNPVVKIVEETQTVTQEEIPAQVNKLYVYNTYSFIQFVPVDTDFVPDIRPDPQSGGNNPDGHYYYDAWNYYNDDYHQSFIIENRTGNIYSLGDDIHIESILFGLIKLEDSPYIYDCRIKDNGELEIFSLFQNTAVSVSGYFKDKHGNNYILNDSLAEKDTETNTCYGGYGYGNAASYFLATDGTALGVIDRTIVVMESQLASRPVSAEDEFDFDAGFAGRGWIEGVNGLELEDVSFTGITKITKIKNKKVYSVSTEGDPSYPYNNRISIKNTGDLQTGYDLVMEYGSWSHWPVRYDMFISTIGGLYGTQDGKVYYYKIDYDRIATDFENEYASERWHLKNTTWESLTPILEGVRFVRAGVWEKITINSRDEYTYVFKDVGGESIPVIIKTSEYVAEDRQLITLKPINR
jgi:hypothetical protein